MPVPTDITTLSTTAVSNSPPGSEAPSLIDDYLRQVLAFIAQLRDRAASGVAFTAVGGIAATNVQAALAELDSEKANASSVTSGSYTPTLTSVVGSVVLVAFQAVQWLRVGNVVTVSGRVATTHSSGGNIQFRISLPVASNFTSVGHCAGTAAELTSAACWVVTADPTNDQALFYNPNTTGVAASTLSFHFTYLIA